MYLKSFSRTLPRLATVIGFYFVLHGNNSWYTLLTVDLVAPFAAMMNHVNDVANGGIAFPGHHCSHILLTIALDVTLLPLILHVHIAYHGSGAISF